MILVLETNGCLLHLFLSSVQVEKELEVIDVENREYEFCDETGQRFVGEIVSPVGFFRSGKFRLKPDGIPDRTVIASFLSRAGSLDRGCDSIKSLDDLRRRLTA
jgi:hypothetical protein